MKSIKAYIGDGFVDINTVEITDTLYLTDLGWTNEGTIPEVQATIPPGIYQFEYVFITEEGDVGFNYKMGDVKPEFVGKDLTNLSKSGFLIFTPMR